MYTDSKIQVNLDLFQNNFKRNRLIKYVKNKITALKHLKWIMHFFCVRGHAGIEGNELVDKLAKEAAVADGPLVYDKIRREVLITRVQENGLNIWQRQWTDTRKGVVTKASFPLVRNRLQEKIPIFPEIRYW